MAKKTQSARLAEAMENGKPVPRADLARKLGVAQDMVASYVAELVRVYGAKVEYNKETKEFRLLNKVDVSPAGRVNKPKAPAPKKASGGSTGGNKKAERNARRRAARAAKKTASSASEQAGAAASAV